MQGLLPSWEAPLLHQHQTPEVQSWQADEIRLSTLKWRVLRASGVFRSSQFWNAPELNLAPDNVQQAPHKLSRVVRNSRTKRFHNTLHSQVKNWIQAASSREDARHLSAGASEWLLAYPNAPWFTLSDAVRSTMIRLRLRDYRWHLLRNAVPSFAPTFRRIANLLLIGLACTVLRETSCRSTPQHVEGLEPNCTGSTSRQSDGTAGS